MELKNIKDSRLREMVKQLENSDDDLYNLLTIEDEDILNDKGMRHALYCLTDNDTIEEIGTHRNVELPNLEGITSGILYDMLISANTHLRIIDTYQTVSLKNGFVIKDVYSGSEWELDPIDVLYTLFDIDHKQAEEVAAHLNLGSYYVLENLQLQYYFDFDEVKYLILNDDVLFENRKTICELIGELPTYDEQAYQKFIEVINEESKHHDE